MAPQSSIQGGKNYKRLRGNEKSNTTHKTLHKTTTLIIIIIIIIIMIKIITITITITITINILYSLREHSLFMAGGGVLKT